MAIMNVSPFGKLFDCSDENGTADIVGDGLSVNILPTSRGWSRLELSCQTGGCKKLLCRATGLCTGVSIHGSQTISGITSPLTSGHLTPQTASMLIIMCGPQFSEIRKKHLVRSERTEINDYDSTKRLPRCVEGESKVGWMPWLKTVAILLNKFTI